MQIELYRRIEESGDRTRIELFQSAMVNTGISVRTNPWSLVVYKMQIVGSKFKNWNY